MRYQTSPAYSLPPLTRITKILMGIIGGLFLAQVALRVALGFDDHRYHALVESVVGLSASGVLHDLRLWQPFTYFWFSPLNSIFSVLMTLLMLWFFAPAVEGRIGSRRLVGLFVAGGLTGGALTLVIGAIAGVSSAAGQTTILGAHGATAALASFLFWSERHRQFHLFFAQVRGLHLFIAFGVLTLLQGAITHPIFAAAPLGGMLAGVFFATPRRSLSPLQRYRLWRVRRRTRVIAGGKDDRDLFH